MRLLTASALVALTIITATAGDQPPLGGPPPGGPKKGGDDKKPLGEKADKKPADPTDTAIAAALANDPDVRMAKAKIQLAEAELAKARQAVTLKVVALKGKIDVLKTEVANLRESVAIITRSVQQGASPPSVLIPERAKLEAALAALASAETEWKLLTAPGAVGPVGDLHVEENDAVARALLYLGAQTAKQEREIVRGQVADRLRAVLDKPVKLGPKGTKFTFPQALEVLKKETGWDVPVRGEFPKPHEVVDDRGNVVRGPDGAPLLTPAIEVVSEGEELPVGAWFQMLEDRAVSQGRYRFYVREYGVLITPTDRAPDAPTLTEFWKQKLPAQGPKNEPAPKN